MSNTYLATKQAMQHSTHLQEFLWNKFLQISLFTMEANKIFNNILNKIENSPLNSSFRDYLPKELNCPKNW